MTRRRLELVVVAVVAVLAFAGLVGAGAGALAAPPTRSWAALAAWYERVGPATGVMVALRFLALLGCTWLLVAASLQLVASFTLRRELQALADGLSPRVLRRLGRGVASFSVTAGLAIPSVVVMPRDDPPGVAVMEVIEDSATPATTVPSAPATPAIPVPAPVDEEVVVEPGDSFWSLAVRVLTGVDGTEPSDGDVAGYWRRLIDANRDRLVDPANPDLIFPAQTLTLPTP